MILKEQLSSLNHNHTNIATALAVTKPSTANVQSPVTMTIRGSQPNYYLVPVQQQTDVERRRKQIRHRIERLENGRQYLKADQKWPSEKSMNLHAYHELRKLEVPQIVVQPPSPRQRHEWYYSQSAIEPSRPSPRTLKRLLTTSTAPRAKFPFPVSTRNSPVREKSFIENSFIYFQFLPTEIRLEIWELELRRPKLIEAQFSSQFYSPTFIGPCTRGTPLLYVNREARDVALCLDYQFLTPMQRDLGKRWSSSPYIPLDEVEEKPVPYVPESDTIFFRSLDRPQGGLQSIATSTSGFDNIRHLALPLPPSGLPLRNEWKVCLSLFRDLKTLTFLVGGKDQSWLQDGEIELRQVEEWYADGRERKMKCDRWLLDVNEVGPFLSGRCFEERMRGSWDDEWRGINVRVVAWKKVV